jgi:hypothetical protein
VTDKAAYGGSGVHWRRAEARIYPSVMLNADLYQQYIGLVRAIAELLEDVRTEDELVVAWTERRELVQEAVSRHQPSMLGLMDHEAVRDAAFCHRHREITREQGKAIAAQRLEEARRTGAEWVVLFEDVTPLGSHRLEMHVASGRALHASSELPLDDEEVAVDRLDAIRVGPEVTRGFEAGSDGLELIVFSPKAPGDAEIVADFFEETAKR